MWFKSSLKRVLPRGLRFAGSTLDEIAIWKHHQTGCRKSRSLYSERVGLKLNIGCGRWRQRQIITSASTPVTELTP
jgi:hypothetical protein